MAKRHRFGAEFVKGDTNVLSYTVKSNVVVFPGDLVFLNKTKDHLNRWYPAASSTPDGYAYPLMCGSTKSGAVTHGNDLLGVAMSFSPYGSTDKISVATTGIFRFPLAATCGTTYECAVSAVSHFARGANPMRLARMAKVRSAGATENYMVQVGSLIDGKTGVTIGYSVSPTTSGASWVDVEIYTKRGKGRPAVGSW